MSEVVVRFPLSVFPFGLLLPSYNLGCLTFPFDVCNADDVSSCGVRFPFPALGIVTILSTSPSPLWYRISACLLASSVRTDPVAEHLTPAQNPGGRALQLHRDFCSRVQLGGPPGHERRIEGNRSTSIGVTSVALRISLARMEYDSAVLSVPRERRVHDERTQAPAPGSSECSQTETSSLLMPNVSIAQVRCSSNISWVKEPADSTIFPDVRNCDVYIRKELYPNVVCHVARPCSEVLSSA